VRHLDFRHGLEKLAGKMARGSGARGGEGQLTGIRARVRDQLRDIVRGNRRMHDQQSFGLEHQRDRGEILDRVVGHL
jgi:hypothetical protein